VELRILAHVSGRASPARGVRAERGHHTATAAEVLGKDPATLTQDERERREDGQLRDHLRHLGRSGLSENLEIPREQAQEYIDTVSRALPARAGLHPADDRAGASATAT
jgi:DNA polymerase-1